MSSKHVQIIALVVFLFLIQQTTNITLASQPAFQIKGHSYLEVIKTTKTLNLDDTMLVWIDINASVDIRNDRWLPADPSLYGIEWTVMTFDPDIEHNNLLWCLAEIQKQDVENLIEIPWIFDITLVKVGSLSSQAYENPKLSLGLQETIGRALQHNGTLQVILWLENSAEPIKKFNDNDEGIQDEISSNVTATIKSLGGNLLRNHYEGSCTLLATIPPKSITKIAENPLHKEGLS